MSGASESQAAVFGALTKFERKLMEKQDVLTTRGKVYIFHLSLFVVDPKGYMLYSGSCAVVESVASQSAL